MLRSRIITLYVLFLIIPLGAYKLIRGDGASSSTTIFGKIGYSIDYTYYHIRKLFGLSESYEDYIFEPTYRDVVEWTDFNYKNLLKYNELILHAAYANEIDPDLIRAVILIESRFNDEAISPKGASGLMQLMPGTAKDMGVQNTMNSAQNIAGGARYLKLMLDRFDGDLKLALAGYNAGPQSVRKRSGIPPYKETRLYVKKVLIAYSLFRGTKSGNDS